MAVIGNELSCLAPLLQALSHCAPDVHVLFGASISAQKPNDRITLVTVTQKFSVNKGIRGIEHLLVASRLSHVFSVGHDKAHGQTDFICPVDYVVNIPEERLIWLGGVPID